MSYDAGASLAHSVGTDARFNLSATLTVTVFRTPGITLAF